ncbi:MAG: hypothetical protein P4L63_02970 [Candidatus Pacebacteria bacterium]|nr:hypothetical protein [Candidatus Paceibacterota bacterium]
MKKATIKIKRNIQNVNITNNNIEMSRVVLNAMLTTLGALALLYFFILGNMVFNIVQRNTLEKENLTLSNQVGNLELSYLSVSNSVDVALSSSMGFKAIPVTYAIRTSLSFNTTADTFGSLKVNNDEI